MKLALPLIRVSFFLLPSKWLQLAPMTDNRGRQTETETHIHRHTHIEEKHIEQTRKVDEKVKVKVLEKCTLEFPFLSERSKNDASHNKGPRCRDVSELFLLRIQCLIKRSKYHVSVK